MPPAFAPDRADQTLNERMRHRCVGDRLDRLDLADAQVGEPTVEAKQRVVIAADMFRWSAKYKGVQRLKNRRLPGHRPPFSMRHPWLTA